MKKAVILFILISALFWPANTPAAVSSGGIVIRGDAPKPTDIVSYYKNENVVYVTKSGTKYHKDGCPYLKSSKIMISLEQAVMEGKQPCSKCFGGK